MSAPRICLIAAVAQNGAIGLGDALPWRLRSDLRRFKALTMGKPLVMGRKTFASIGAPLPGRRMIVVTRDAVWSHPGVEAAHNLPDALALASDAGAEQIFIGGGAEIYAQTIGLADRLLITQVEMNPPSDARFPAIDPRVWREARREKGVRGPGDDAEFCFVDYERR